MQLQHFRANGMKALSCQSIPAMLHYWLCLTLVSLGLPPPHLYCPLLGSLSAVLWSALVPRGWSLYTPSVSFPWPLASSWWYKKELGRHEEREMGPLFSPCFPVWLQWVSQRPLFSVATAPVELPFPWHSSHQPLALSLTPHPSRPGEVMAFCYRWPVGCFAILRSFL